MRYVYLADAFFLLALAMVNGVTSCDSGINCHKKGQSKLQPQGGRSSVNQDESSNLHKDVSIVSSTRDKVDAAAVETTVQQRAVGTC